MSKLVISDRWEPLALHRAFVEAKLHPRPKDKDVPGSPILARLAERVIESLIVAETKDGKTTSREDWDLWRKAEQHPQRVEFIRYYLYDISDWKTRTGQERRQLVLDSLSPLVPNEDTIQDLIKSASHYKEIW